MIALVFARLLVRRLARQFARLLAHQFARLLTLLYVLPFALLSSPVFAAPADCAHSLSFFVGGGLTVTVQGADPVEREDYASHLPGYSTEPFPNLARVLINANLINPEDLTHYVYAQVRRKWLARSQFPVHAACIGFDTSGCVLLVGPSGSGKTTLALEAAQKLGFKVLSGDKTLVHVRDDGHLEALAGTRLLTRRQTSAGVRDTVTLEPPQYLDGPVVVRAIFLVGLNEGVRIQQKINFPSSLHRLYPLFLDKAREDVLLQNGRTLIDGAPSASEKKRFTRLLRSGLIDLPVYKSIGSTASVLADVRAALKPEESRGAKKILMGICGIGNGHLNRQLPLLEHFLKNQDQVVVFAYGESLKYLRERLADINKLTIVPIANPYFVGNAKGLDFAATAEAEVNRVDFNTINARAMNVAAQTIGRPDLVISDYEQMSAQYAYAKDAPLFTIDQQSKLLGGNFPETLNGTGYQDELERLRMFFPTAERRIVTTFFRLPHHSPKMEVFAPSLRSDVLLMKPRTLSARPTLLVYFTSQDLGSERVPRTLEALQQNLPDEVTAHVFLPAGFPLPQGTKHVVYYKHRDPRFDDILRSAHGIITTAGHTLLSEAMHLGIPVYALPLALYEQQLNAHVINQNNFGLSEPELTGEGLRTFVHELSTFATNIENDRTVLLRAPGNDAIIQRIESYLRSTP